jgi:hypothetical protein
VLWPIPLCAQSENPDKSETGQLPASEEQLQTPPKDPPPDPGGRWSDGAELHTNATAHPGTDDDPGGQLILSGLGSHHSQAAIDGMDATVLFFQQERGRSFGHASLFPGAVQDMSFSIGNGGIGATHTGGLHMRAISMSGTREFHGKAFLYDQQNLLSAANPYSVLPALAAGVWTPQPVNPQDMRVEWGFSAGGPVRRVQQLFCFLAFDGLNYNYPGVARVRNFAKFFTPPTQQQMQYLGARLNTTTGLATDLYNKEIELLAAEELGIVPRRENSWSLFPRVDWSPRKQHQLTAEMSLSGTDSPAGARNGRTETYGTTSFGNRSSQRELLLLRWQALLTPYFRQQLAIQLSSDTESESHQQPNNFENGFLKNSWGLLPQVSVASSYGLTLGKPATLDRRAFPGERQLQIAETLGWSRGHRSVQMGFDYRYATDEINHLENQTGSYDYASLTNFISDLLTYQSYGWNNSNLLQQHGCGLTGLGLWPCYAWYQQSVGPAEWSFNTADWALFTTTEWRATNRLTLSAGLRYQYQQIPNQQSALVNPDIPGTSRMPHDGNNIAPSIGLAWSPFGRQGTVIHAGLGLFYGRTPNVMVLAGLTQTGSAKGTASYYFRPYDVAAPPFPYVFAAAPTASVKPSALYFAPHFQNPQIEQLSASIEQLFPRHNRITLDTFLSLAHELPKFIDTNINTASAQTVTYLVQSSGGPIPAGTYTGPFYTKRINSNYQQITEVQSETNLNYWAAQLRWAHTSRSGVDFHLLYTYAKSVDGNPNESQRIGTNDPLDPLNPKTEVGRSNFDQRHALSASATLHMPRLHFEELSRAVGGLSFAPVFYWRSGLPYSMHTFGAIPVERTLSGYNLIGLAAGINGSGGDNRVPTVARNIFRSPDTYSAHARLGDRWSLGSNRRLIAEVESYNLLNHQNVTKIDTNGYEITAPGVNASLPVLTWQSGANGKTTFGQPYSSNSTADYPERRFQFGLRLEF